MTLCEEDCNLVDYNYTTKKAKCSCIIKLSLSFLDNIKFDKNKLYKSFTDINNFANIQFMKCYKNVLNKDNIKYNYGFYINISILFLFFITLFIFYCKDYFYIIIIIRKIIDAKRGILQSKGKGKRRNNSSNIPTQNNNVIFPQIKINKKKKKRKKRKKGKRKKFSDDLYENNKNKISNCSKNIIKKKSAELPILNNNNTKYEEILKYNDKEWNNLSYEKALILDKRKCFEYYI